MEDNELEDELKEAKICTNCNINKWRVEELHDDPDNAIISLICVKCGCQRQIVIPYTPLTVKDFVDSVKRK